jgi:AhpC/TSA family
MHATSGTDDKARVGDAFPTLQLAATSGQLVTVPDLAGDYVHLQLRRFAGCPICNLHLRSIVTRHDEIRSAGIREVAVFHSRAQSTRPDLDETLANSQIDLKQIREDGARDRAAPSGSVLEVAPVQVSLQDAHINDSVRRPSQSGGFAVGLPEPGRGGVRRTAWKHPRSLHARPSITCTDTADGRARLDAHG